MKTFRIEDMRDDYKREDLGKGVREKYYEEYKKDATLVLLSLDVAKAFPDEDAVNNALRGLLKVARESIGPTRRCKRTRHTVQG